MSDKVEILAYYFPNYHPDPRNEDLHARGWSEWKLVREARPRFEGHRQPRVPLWGYEDESDPKVMAKKIDAAADHGLTGFIFDWYWYDDGPFLDRCLERGFLHAPNNNRLKFALMWANHTWADVHPARNKAADSTVLYKGAVTRQTFDAFTDYVTGHYFVHPSYWMINGRPFFSIYDTKEFVEGMGGIEQARAALEHFRAKVKRCGFLGLHLNFIIRDERILIGETEPYGQLPLIEILGFDSCGSYVWIHDVPLPIFPATPYQYVADEVVKRWAKRASECPVPYIPNVTVGWDASPRVDRSKPFVNAGYPFMPTLNDATPEAFKQALVRAKRFVDSQKSPVKTLTINAWNEWTEGSYLEPDTTYGMRYLEAIKDVFGVYQDLRDTGRRSHSPGIAQIEP